MLIILLLVVFMIGTFFGFMFIKNTIAHWLVGRGMIEKWFGRPK